jgi:hypothetical protein
MTNYTRGISLFGKQRRTGHEDSMRLQQIVLRLGESIMGNPMK